jgi:SAM-dependent methyltransferase
MSETPDPFRRGEYRRIIGWEKRLRREAPFLERFLSSCVAPRVLDLGCGSGEHAAWFADRGAESVGVDQSEGQIESARELCTPERPKLHFLQARFGNLRASLSGDFGGAICLGNVLPYLDREALRTALADWASLLASGAPLWIQLLNYAGLRARGVRHLPLLQSELEDGSEQVLLRWMRFLDPETVLFYPTTLRFAGEDVEPELLKARAVRLTAWTAAALRDELHRAGFELADLWGSVEFGDYVESESQDLIVGAQRR